MFLELSPWKMLQHFQNDPMGKMLQHFQNENDCIGKILHYFQNDLLEKCLYQFMAYHLRKLLQRLQNGRLEKM